MFTTVSYSPSESQRGVKSRDVISAQRYCILLSTSIAYIWAYISKETNAVNC